MGWIQQGFPLVKENVPFDTPPPMLEIVGAAWTKSMWDRRGNEGNGMEVTQNEKAGQIQPTIFLLMCSFIIKACDIMT